MQKVFNPASLATLRPDTLVGMENVAFAVRAQAMPGVVEVLNHISDVDSIHGEDSDPIDVRDLMPISGAGNEEVVVITDDHIIVGALAYDQDCSHCDPTEGDGNGKVVRYQRHNESAVGEMYAALGLDQYGDKDLKADVVEELVLENALKVLRKDHSAMTALSNRCRSFGYSGLWDDVIARIRTYIARTGWDGAMDEIATELFGERYWSRVPTRAADALSNLDFALREDEAEKAWEKAVDEGLLGNPLAVLLDVYEHGGVSYSISGEGMQCRWDTSRGGAMWIPDSCAVENITSSVLREEGYGEVAWFGASGSESDPLNAGYSLDGGVTWVKGFSSWAAALAEVRKQVPETKQVEFRTALREAAVKYGRSTVEEYNSWVNGDVHGVLVYVIDRKTEELLDDMTDEAWGHIGSDYAEDTLHDTVLRKIAYLTKTLH